MRLFIDVGSQKISHGSSVRHAENRLCAWQNARSFPNSRDHTNEMVLGDSDRVSPIMRHESRWHIYARPKPELTEYSFNPKSRGAPADADQMAGDSEDVGPYALLT